VNPAQAVLADISFGPSRPDPRELPARPTMRAVCLLTPPVAPIFAGELCAGVSQPPASASKAQALLDARRACNGLDGLVRPILSVFAMSVASNAPWPRRLSASS
jgi:hypothetical protein